MILLACLILVMSGCTTTTDDRRLYAGANVFQTTYDGREPGRHWVRPQEFTFELRAPVTYETNVTLSKGNVEETVVFGYPQPGQKANPFVTIAVSRAVADHGSDGFLVSSYHIERNIQRVASSSIDENDSAYVTVQGRLLEIVSLGEVSTERADLERFVTSTVVEEHEEEGVVTTTTVRAPINTDSFYLQESTAGSIMTRASAPETSERTSRPFLRMLLFAGGTIAVVGLIGAAVGGF